MKLSSFLLAAGLLGVGSCLYSQAAFERNEADVRIAPEDGRLELENNGSGTFGEIVTSLSTSEGVMDVYKNSICQNPDGTLVARMTFVLNGKSYVVLVQGKKGDAQVVMSGSVNRLCADLDATPSLREAMIRECDVAKANVACQEADARAAGDQDMNAKGKRSWLRCGMAWLGLGVGVAKHEPISIACGLYDVACNCFGWCL